MRALANSALADKVRGAVLLHLPEDTSSEKPSLQLCVEVDAGCEVSREDVLDWDAALSSEAEAYRGLREQGDLAVPILHIAPRGAFRVVRQQFASSMSSTLSPQLPGVSLSQVKMPLVLHGRLARELLEICRKGTVE